MGMRDEPPPLRVICMHERVFAIERPPVRGFTNWYSVRIALNDKMIQ